MLFIELIVVAVLIVVNGLLAMSELAIVSSRPSQLAAMAKKRVKGADQALVLASDPGKFLSTVQIGITLIGVLSGAFSGATLGQRLSVWLTELGASRTIADTAGVAAVVTIITCASLIVGELVPKQIALRNSEKVAARVAPLMTALARVSFPLVWLLDQSGKVFLRILGHHGNAEEAISEDEIHSMVAEADSAGVLEPGEKDMISGVMRLGDLPVGAVMTPRHDVVMIDVTTVATAISTTILASNHSRFVAVDGNPDHVLGVLQAKDLLDAYLSGQQLNIRALVRQAPLIPETADARDVIDILRKSPIHMGLIHDEYGSFQGIVTSADILESIVGSFQTEDGPAEPAVVEREDGSYLIAGWMPVIALAQQLSITLPSKYRYQTFAGFLLHEFGKIPAVTERIQILNWSFEIVDMDGRRIDKVLAMPVSDIKSR